MKTKIIIPKNAIGNSGLFAKCDTYCDSKNCPEKYQYCPDPRKPKYTPAVVNPGKDK